MTGKKYSVLITDLDNTLFDWFAQWHSSFSAMLEQISYISDIPADDLVSDIKSIHQKHGTSEYAFLIEEIPSLRQKFPNEDLIEKFDPAIHAYRKKRKETLRLYPGVLGTLRTLKENGIIIVGYTESMAFYSNYRVRALQLDGLIDFLYSPRDHDLPRGLTPDQIRKYPAEKYELKHTIHRHTPAGELKPNPRLLLDIVKDLSIAPSDAIYVGDNLWKDVQMAQEAGIIDVHANYGTSHTKEEYQLLVDVTHWTDEDVKREQELKRHHVNPTYTLEVTFAELLDKFSFQTLADRPWVAHQIDIWRKTVDVQMHFNEIEMKIRNLAMTLIGAAIAGVGFTLKEGLDVTIGQQPFPLAAFLLIGAGIFFLFFWFMDRHWYHRLLYGSVMTGMEIEQKMKSAGLVANLTDKIGQSSPLYIMGKKIRSSAKIDFTYYMIFGIFFTCGVFLLNYVLGILILFIAIAVFLIWFSKLPDSE